MMRNRFDQQLEQLHADLITMGNLCETAIAAAVDAATKGDEAMAKAAIADDSKIDEMERSIEHLCLKLLLQQQPVARDLRTISSALKMISDMERIEIRPQTLRKLPGLSGAGTSRPMRLCVPWRRKPFPWFKKRFGAL